MYTLSTLSTQSNRIDPTEMNPRFTIRDSRFTIELLWA